MDFGLSDEQQAIKEVAARFGRERLAPYYMQRERQNGLDRTLLREMAGLGFMGMGVSAERGGMALDCVTRGIVTEEIAYHDFNVAYLMLLGSLMGELLCEHAQPEVVEEWLPRVVGGEALVALGLTEPRGGSDAANLQLKAERQGDEYVLSGEKTSITFSDQADLIILFARTGKPEQGARGVSAFLVPLNLPGISRTRFNDVGTKLQRFLQHRAAESIVDYENCTSVMGYFGTGSDVCNTEGRVGRGFDVNHDSILFNRIFYVVNIRAIDKG